MKTFIISRYHYIRELYHRYERFLMPITLLGGFLFDYITFTSIQISTTFILLALYWLAVGTTIVFMHLYDAKKIAEDWPLNYLRLFSPLILQFSFGSLLGSSLIFYWFSGALAVSWPVMIILVILLISNEIFRRYFDTPAVHMSVYYFATISLLSVLLPFAFNSLSVWLFLAAGALSLIIFLPYIHYLSRIAPQLTSQKRLLYAYVVAIAFAMNILYFTNIIPPIPLALREAGLYHSLTVSGNTYTFGGEYENFLKTAIFGQTLHVVAGERVYLYTAIFAPADLRTNIVHHWQYYDTAQEAWVDKAKSMFGIRGGHQQGYKGYSWLSNLTTGRWRVYVENERGQVLGRIRFSVVSVDAPANLQEVIR